MNSQKTKIDNLTGLRALAALWVCLYHSYLYFYFNLTQPMEIQQFMDPRLPAIIRFGYLGVDVFFVLSGFVIAYNYWDGFAKYGLEGFRKYIAYRVARIYPAFIFVFLITSLLSIYHITFSQRDWQGFFLSLPLILTLLHTLPHDSLTSLLNTFWSVNAPIWTISCEWMVYIFFPFLVVFFKDLKVWVFILISIVILIWLQVWVEVRPPSFGNITLPSFAFFIYGLPAMLRVIAEFLLGCAVCLYWRKNIRHHELIDGVICLLALIAMIVIFELNLFVTLVIPLIALIVFGMAQSPPLITRLLANKIMIYLGDVSYSFYLVHFVFLGLFIKFLKYLNAGPYLAGQVGIRFALLGVYVLLTLSISMVIYHLIEVPGRRYIRRLAK